MKYEKYLVMGIVVVVCMTMISLQADAHEPRYMKLTYEPDMLSVTILHISPARSFHYVYKIDVENNGFLVDTQLYQSQPRFFFNTYNFSISAIAGDEITVTANCVLFGSLTKSITVS